MIKLCWINNITQVSEHQINLEKQQPSLKVQKHQGSCKGQQGLERTNASSQNKDIHSWLSKQFAAKTYSSLH